MKKTILALALCATLGAAGQVSLDSCLRSAKDNYPLIKEYSLVERTTELDLSDINRGWLPRVGVYAQASIQNVVPAFPEALESIIDQMGHDIRGIGKLQYKVGVDVNQTVWDGGASRHSRNICRAEGELRCAQLDVELYAIRRRVENLFFGILLLDKQIEISENTVELLRANHRRVQCMVTDGVAMQADADMIEAQLLTTSQQIAGARATKRGYVAALEAFTGMTIGEQSLLEPSAELGDGTGERPEMAYYAAGQRLNAARRHGVDASVMPRIGFFAQGWYGYPGLNYFESMMNRDLSFNAMGGIKISWNIDAFYTRRNQRDKLAFANETIDAERRTFLLNTDMQARQERAEIAGLRDVVADDDRIVELRHNVCLAAESQLANGMIDATDLLTKITDESMARLNAGYHRIQLTQKIYQLKYTLNR